MKRRNSNSWKVITYVIACLGAVIIIGTQWFTGVTKRKITEPTWTQQNNADIQAQVEQYIKDESTGNDYGDYPRAGDAANDVTKSKPEPSTPIDATDVQSLLWKKVKAAGFSDEAAAATLANIGYESGGFNPQAVNPNSGAYGLCQWLGTRQSNLKSRPNYETAEVQIDYFLEEWVSFNYDKYCSDSKYSEYAPAKAYGTNAGYNIPASRTITSKDAYMNSTDINQCTYLFMLGFERPGVKDKSLGTRCSSAATILKTFGGKV